LKRISTHLASVLSYMDSVFATALAYALLGQTPSTAAIIGGSLIISGALSTILEFNHISRLSACTRGTSENVACA